MGPSARPAEPNGGPLADYVGTYGDRTISLADGKLHIQRPLGVLLELVSTGPDAFTITGPTAQGTAGRFEMGSRGEVDTVILDLPQGAIRFER